MSLKLFEHNQSAFISVIEMLSVTGKAAVIHPTGTGKSYIGFKLCEEFPDKAYDSALLYFKTHGNLDVPLRFKTASGFQLGIWINEQRNRYKTDSLSKEYKKGKYSKYYYNYYYCKKSE